MFIFYCFWKELKSDQLAVLYAAETEAHGRGSIWTAMLLGFVLNIFGYNLSILVSLKKLFVGMLEKAFEYEHDLYHNKWQSQKND